MDHATKTGQRFELCSSGGLFLASVVYFTVDTGEVLASCWYETNPNPAKLVLNLREDCSLFSVAIGTGVDGITP